MMKKREIALFFSFVALFVLFALFQNFSFVQKLPEQSKEIAKKGVQFFRPYLFKEHIGNLETPIGYKQTLHADGPIVFDHKKYLDNKLQEAPLFKDIKDYIDFSSAENTTVPCQQDPTARVNNCLVEYDSMQKNSSGSMKFRTNPLRKTASVSYSGDINSAIIYDDGVNVELKKQISPNSNLNFKIKSQDHSGAVNIDVKW